MKKLSINESGEVSCGPKWQNTELENDDNLHSPTVTTAHEDNEDQIPKGKKRFEVSVKDGELMYVAALQGDWVAAEVLLDRDPKLAYDYITEEGDRALHVAVAMKHEEFVKKLVARMSDEDMALRNGHGYTAFCYAAMSGTKEIADVMLNKNPDVVTARDEENATPLRKAALRGNQAMLSTFLSNAKDENLSMKEWFDLFLLTIRGKMFAVAVLMLLKNMLLSMMANEEGTALHQLARVEVSREAEMFNELAELLWHMMLTIEKARLMELIRKPVHIIHEAAKAGQIKMITMLARSFPNLVLETDSNGYTMFHLAVMYRRTAVFNLAHQVEGMLHLRTMWQDREGNNILHLAATKPAIVTQMKLPPAHQMQRELKFFEAVKEIVPPSCLMTKNGEGMTLRELFSQTHKKLLKESEVWMINKADSLMLIATILLTIVFAAAFTVPGGYDGQTGEPLLVKKWWFRAFVISEILSLVFTLISIIIFQCIMASRFALEEYQYVLPGLMKVGFQFLLLSLAFAFSAFMASISLFNMGGINGLKWYVFAMLGLYGLLWATRELTAVFRHTTDRMSDDTLFQQKLVKKRFNIIWKSITTRMKNILVTCNELYELH